MQDFAALEAAFRAATAGEAGTALEAALTAPPGAGHMAAASAGAASSSLAAPLQAPAALVAQLPGASSRGEETVQQQKSAPARTSSPSTIAAAGPTAAPTAAAHGDVPAASPEYLRIYTAFDAGLAQGKAELNSDLEAAISSLGADVKKPAPTTENAKMYQAFCVKFKGMLACTQHSTSAACLRSSDSAIRERLWLA